MNTAMSMMLGKSGPGRLKSSSPKCDMLSNIDNFV